MLMFSRVTAIAFLDTKMPIKAEKDDQQDKTRQRLTTPDIIPFRHNICSQTKKTTHSNLNLSNKK